MAETPKTEVYCVVSVPGGLEDGRADIATALRYAAEQIERRGYHGGVYGTEDDSGADTGIEIEVHIVTDEDAAEIGADAEDGPLAGRGWGLRVVEDGGET